jgi:hypothetical protein
MTVETILAESLGSQPKNKGFDAPHRCQFYEKNF